MGEDCEGERWMWWSGRVGVLDAVYLLGRDCEGEGARDGG